MPIKLASSSKFDRTQKSMLKSALPEKEYTFSFCDSQKSFTCEGAKFTNFVPHGESEMVNQIKSIKSLHDTKRKFFETILRLPDDELERFLVTPTTTDKNRMRYSLIHQDYTKYCKLVDVQKYNINKLEEYGLRVYGYTKGDEIIFVYFDPHHLIATTNQDKYEHALKCTCCISTI